MPNTLVHSRWKNGSLVFHDADDLGVGAEIFQISPSTIYIGTSTNDVTVTAYGDVTLYGDLDLADEDISVAVGKYIYLDGSTGNDYLRAATDNNVILNGQTTVKIGIAGTAEVSVTGAALYPETDNGQTLGILNTNEWSDLFLADGGVIGWNNNDVTLTHTANLLTLGSGSLTIGASAAGGDLILWGNTAGRYVQWQASVNGMYFVGGATLNVVSGTATSLGGALNVSGNIVCAGVGDFAGYVSTATVLNAGGNIAGGGTLAITGGSTLGGAVSCNDTLNVAGVATVSNATEATSTVGAALVVTGGIANGADCYFGDNIYLTSGAVLDFNAGNVTITHSAALLTIAGGGLTVDVAGSMVGDVNFYGESDMHLLWNASTPALTLTDAPVASTITGDEIGFTSTMNATAAYTGWALGFFGTTTLSNTSGTVGNAAGGCFEVNFTSAMTGGVAGMVCGAYVGAYSSSTTAGSVPSTGLWVETIAGTGADMSTTPLISLVTSGAGTHSAIAFELGNAAAGKTVTVTNGGMYYNGTIHITANAAARYIPLSTVEGTFTTAYPIALGNDVELRMGDNAEFYFHVINANSMRLTPSASGKVFTFGQNTLGINTYFYSDTTGRRMMWDAVNNQLVFTLSHILLGDMSYLYFGGGNDFHMHFDAANMWMVPSSLAVPLSFGTNGAGCNVYFNSDTSGARMLWDADNLYLTFLGTSGLLLPVRTSGILTTGSVWLDTTDDKLHFYDGAAERTVTSA